MSTNFSVHERNPNNLTGGAGCLATGRRQGEDCSGLWIHFYKVSTEHDESPYAVLCEKHLTEAADTFDREEVQTDGDLPPASSYQRETILDPTA